MWRFMNWRKRKATVIFQVKVMLSLTLNKPACSSERSQGGSLAVACTVDIIQKLSLGFHSQTSSSFPYVTTIFFLPVCSLARSGLAWQANCLRGTSKLISFPQISISLHNSERDLARHIAVCHCKRRSGQLNSLYYYWNRKNAEVWWEGKEQNLLSRLVRSMPRVEGEKPLFSLVEVDWWLYQETRSQFLS